MKKIVLTPNPYRDRNFKYVTLADKLLREAGLETRICLAFDVDRSFELPDNVVLTELNHELRDADLLVCFGGDGLIVCTPTGSTAYSMSAGGPLVEPAAQNIVLTPICAHDMQTRAIVTSADREITVQLARTGRKNAFLSVDGGKAVRLSSGDRITIRRSEHVTRLLRLTGRSFFEIIQNKFR